MKEHIRIGDLKLYNNHHLIAFNKPSGVPVQPDLTDDPSLLQIGSVYCKSKLHLVHRLDRPVSGVVLLAKHKSAKIELHRQFRERLTQKTYLAIVATAPKEPKGELVQYLVKDSKKKRAVIATKDAKGAQEARLTYELIDQSERYFLLKINLHTGRYHQIRAQLSDMGCTIKGDAKYGFRRRNADRSIDLHAWKLQFEHPVSKQKEEIIAPLPDNPLWQAFNANL